MIEIANKQFYQSESPKEDRKPSHIFSSVYNRRNFIWENCNTGNGGAENQIRDGEIRRSINRKSLLPLFAAEETQ